MGGSERRRAHEAQFQILERYQLQWAQYGTGFRWGVGGGRTCLNQAENISYIALQDLTFLCSEFRITLGLEESEAIMYL